MANNQNKGRGWFGDTDEHSKIGEKGGQAAQASGNAHQLTDEERSRGGQNSPTKFRKGDQRTKAAARKGGQN